ncbi:unnamed protein product [Phytophthora lilii]|uniref:Unnamed protein product n=1 Tax=Phytophthora lilii TaxID=2077276 RepID=A0A9W6X6C5_9STRA|nr:unnamed protein product [Phytophthora lilii]
MRFALVSAAAGGPVRGGGGRDTVAVGCVVGYGGSSGALNAVVESGSDFTVKNCVDGAIALSPADPKTESAGVANSSSAGSPPLSTWTGGGWRWSCSSTTAALLSIARLASLAREISGGIHALPVGFFMLYIVLNLRRRLPLSRSGKRLSRCALYRMDTSTQ